MHSRPTLLPRRAERKLIFGANPASHTVQPVCATPTSGHVARAAESILDSLCIIQCAVHSTRSGALCYRCDTTAGGSQHPRDRTFLLRVPSYLALARCSTRNDFAKATVIPQARVWHAFHECDFSTRLAANGQVVKWSSAQEESLCPFSTNALYSAYAAVLRNALRNRWLPAQRRARAADCPIWRAAVVTMKRSGSALILPSVLPALLLRSAAYACSCADACGRIASRAPAEQIQRKERGSAFTAHTCGPRGRHGYLMGSKIEGGVSHHVSRKLKKKNTSPI